MSNRGQARHELPETLPGATEFTDDPNFGDPIWVVAELLKHPDILDPLLAATDFESDARPKRPGIAWANLRASAALLLEWFRIALRHGWFGSHRHRNLASPVRFHAGRRLERLLNFRQREGLNLPYGPAAIASGIMLPEASKPPGTNSS